VIKMKLNKILLMIGICILLLSVIGCDSYSTCKRDCQDILMCGDEGQMYATPRGHICSSNETVYCFDKCSGGK
jgi:hypothetical protein